MGVPKITEQQVVESWERWGDGKPLKPGFAKWLADFLNEPPDLFPIPECMANDPFWGKR